MYPSSLPPLYPLQFTPVFKDKLWGGEKIKTLLNKDFSPLPNCGESWEISGVPDHASTVAHGELKGKKLTSVTKEYKAQLLGERVWNQFGEDFPLLIKFIDAKDDLSIQVHPDNALAKQKHNSLGKTEMWYVLQADKGATLISGFNQPTNKNTYLKHLKDKDLKSILNVESVKSGDVFFIPTGRVHSIGKGVLLAEIQQTSDITYRIYDWGRVDDKGKARELHTEEALEAMDFKKYDYYKTPYHPSKDASTSIVECPYFKTSIISLSNSLEIDYGHRDSFSIYIVVEGNGRLSLNETGNKRTNKQANKQTNKQIHWELKMGDVFLLPASLPPFTLSASSNDLKSGNLKIIETYIP